MRRMVWTTVGAALIFVGITTAWTQSWLWRGRNGPMWFHHGPMGFVARELDLSDTQKSQIRSIWEGERPNVVELVHEFASEQRDMDALTFQDGAPDDGRIRDISARQGATLAKLLAEKERLTGKIYFLVLNAAQRAKADELRKRWNTQLDYVADRIGNKTGRK